VVVPWNIVAYNIFSGGGKGPNIFGTEPWDFYLRNLVLNFNIWTLLALVAAPLLALQYVTGSHTSAYGLMKNAVFVLPFYMWLAIFTLQPHKEERFMYPAYPFLALNAAVSMHVILTWLGNASPRTLVGKLPAQLKLAAVGLTMVLAVDMGVLRTIGMVTAYRAPLQVYSQLSRETGLDSQTTVCMGKEWYRFPSSFFLPQGVHAKFVRSEFKGLLPGEFSEAKEGFGFFPGTWLVPPNMNDENIEDPTKYVRRIIIYMPARSTNLYRLIPITVTI
jgi:alpha-1,2-mannosyltransferase